MSLSSVPNRRRLPEKLPVSLMAYEIHPPLEERCLEVGEDMLLDEGNILVEELLLEILGAVVETAIFLRDKMIAAVEVREGLARARRCFDNGILALLSAR